MVEIRVLHVHAHVQHFLTFQYFALHIHIFRSVHGSHMYSMCCHVASPQEQMRAHAYVMSCTCNILRACAQVLHSSHFSISLRMSTFRCARCTGVAACVVIASPQNKFRVQTCHVGVGVAPLCDSIGASLRKSP